MEKEILAASDLNKYAYCPYQWYYERKIGRSTLRKLYKERNERLSLKDSTESHFTRGLNHHKKSYLFLRIRRVLWRLLLIMLLMAIVGGYLWYRLA